jgi:GTP cyclohydrolase II
MMWFMRNIAESVIRTPSVSSVLECLLPYLCRMSEAVHLSSARLPTAHGLFTLHAFDSGKAEQPHVALVHGDWQSSDAVWIRIHSECMTGDVFGSTRCDCGAQLHESMRVIGQEAGVLIYLRQEGRNIGLVNKLHAYNLQDEGRNTAEANEDLGFHADARDYVPAIQILRYFQIQRMRLLTNNPQKCQALEDAGFEVERAPLLVGHHAENANYLDTKQNVFGHWINNHP